MNKKIFRSLVSQLRDIRRCPVEIRHVHMERFYGYCLALLELDLIDVEFRNRLIDVSLNAYFLLLGRRILSRDSSSVVSSSVEVVQDDSATEQVSAPAASVELPVCRLSNRSFYMFCKKLHPREWCPYRVYMDFFAFGKVPSGWSPLPGRRPLVGGEGQVRVSSGQAST